MLRSDDTTGVRGVAPTVESKSGVNTDFPDEGDIVLSSENGKYSLKIPAKHIGRNGFFLLGVAAALTLVVMLFIVLG
jgi:hypothetical protein